jgi:hypothetical protein
MKGPVPEVPVVFDHSSIITFLFDPEVSLA